MSETSRRPDSATRHDAPIEPGFSVKEQTAGVLARTLDEAHWARVRAQTRTRPLGFHGEGFERRAAAVERIVEKFNERAVKKARKDALAAGWTKEQLASSGLSGDRKDPDTAQA